MKVEIRRAKPTEASALTQLAQAAKRHWGYPERWLELWRPDLTITPSFVAGNEVYVATVGDEIVGCCALVPGQSLIELEHMWIDPKYMGRGVGRELFRHARARAVALNFAALEITSDPNAEGFYQRMGAVRIGEVQSKIDGRPRILPRMKIDLIQTA